MKYLLLLLVTFSFTIGFTQQKKDTLNSIHLDEIVVSSQRFAKSKRKISQQIESISKKEIEFQNFQNSADVLGNSGTLAVQKSQQGGGSPVIRGFEASRILILVDGIRMNNLIYRGGHLQNCITVDKYSIESTDILFGPSSTIYGSDALGGAIYFQTKAAKLVSENNNKQISGSIVTNYSSVNEGKTSHLEVNFGQKKWALLTSLSYSDFGDLKMGKKQNGTNAFFGERSFYVETSNGIDSQVANSDSYIQKYSGYKQIDLMQKLVFQQSSSTQHSLNFQYSTSSEIPRYDRLTDLKTDGTLKSAVWKYGPQKRVLAIYKITKEKVFLDSDLNLNLSYQNSEESRINRNFGSENENSRIEKVNVFAMNSDFKTKIGKGDFIYGADIYFDNLNSSASKKNILSGVSSTLDTRYPDGKNTTFRAEGFVAMNSNLSKLISLNASFRGGYTVLNSTLATNFFNLPFSEIEQKNFIYCGAVGIVNNPTKNLKIACNVASAYRVPNIDDLSKIFESGAGTLIVPNKNLKPEKTVTADISVTLWSGSRFQFENTFYVTKLFDPITTAAYTFNDQTTIDYEGQNSTIVANQNQGKGTITGWFSVIKGYITKSLFAYSSFNFIQGNTENETGKQPLDHMAPMYGKSGITFEKKSFSIDFYTLYNGKKELTSYSLSGEDNLQYAPKTGMPSWQTYNLKAGFLILKEVMVFTGIENVMDLQYRTFASGISAGGRNIYLGGTYKF